VTYLDETTKPTRSSYEVLVYNGILVDNLEHYPLGGSLGKEYISVMSPTGQIYVGQQYIGVFHHSSFLAGNPVSYAGHLEIKNGIISQITARSGHYQPPFPLFNNQLINELATRGVDITDLWKKSIKGY